MDTQKINELKDILMRQRVFQLYIFALLFKDLRIFYLKYIIYSLSRRWNIEKYTEIRNTACILQRTL